MILDLIEGIANNLKNEWNISIYKENAGDTETDNPNFTIIVPKSEEKKLMGNRCVRQISVDIYYYAGNAETNTEYYRVAERLFEIMDNVSLSDGGNARGQNKKFEFTEGVIIFHVDFDFILTVGKVINQEDYMETMKSNTYIE